MLRWYLILTKPARELLARKNLQRQGYETYFPQALQRVRSQGRWRERIVALFPRYLFVALNPDQALAPVCSTIGLAQVVRFGSEYTVVPDAVVQKLKSCADARSGLHCIGQDFLLRRGAAVTVAAGAFEGLQGVFERYAGSERVVVLLRLLHQDVPTCLSVDCVQPRKVA